MTFASLARRVGSLRNASRVGTGAAIAEARAASRATSASSAFFFFSSAGDSGDSGDSESTKSTTTSTRFLLDRLGTAVTRKPGKHRASAAIVLASFAPQTPPFGGRHAFAVAVVLKSRDEDAGDASSGARSAFGTVCVFSLPESLSSAALTSAGVNPCRFAERAARVSATCRFFSNRFSPFASRGFFWRRASSARRVAPGAEAPARPVLHAHAGAPPAPGAEAAATISSAVASGGNHGAPSSSDPDDDDVEDARARRGSRGASDVSSSDASSSTASAANADPNLTSCSTSSSELDALVACSRYAAAPSMRALALSE